MGVATFCLIQAFSTVNAAPHTPSLATQSWFDSLNLQVSPARLLAQPNCNIQKQEPRSRNAFVRIQCSPTGKSVTAGFDQLGRALYVEKKSRHAGAPNVSKLEARLSKQQNGLAPRLSTQIKSQNKVLMRFYCWGPCEQHNVGGSSTGVSGSRVVVGASGYHYIAAIDTGLGRSRHYVLSESYIDVDALKQYEASKHRHK